jgi:AcrR family transcriptional regulator
VDRRHGIIRAAETLFAENGFGATRVAEVAAAAGLSPGAGGLYRHFASKQALLSAVIDLALDRLHETLEQRAAFEALDFPLNQKVEQIGRMLIARGRESRELLIIMERDLPRFPDLLARVRRDLVAPALGSLENWLAEQVSEPARERFDAAALAQVAWDGICRRVTSYEKQPAISDAQFIAAWSLALNGALVLANQTPLEPAEPAQMERGRGAKRDARTADE